MAVEAAAGQPAVIAEELVKRFGDFTAVDHLSFEIQRGEIFGFLGPNGSGKSTTIRMLCGLLLPTEGSGRVGGVDIVAEPERVRRQIGYMSQEFSLYRDLSVQENLEFYGGAYGVVGRLFAERSSSLLERLDLAAERDRLAGTLSTGLQQRLALACALLHQPPILFLDEPTSGVDPVSRRGFFDLLGELARSGVSILITTHVMDEAEYCNRLVLIHRGRRMALGTPGELKAQVPGRLMQVRAEPSMPALDLLAQRPEVLDVSLFGTALHVAVADAVSEPAELIRSVLAPAGIEVGEIRAVRPTLEHAFLSLVGEEPE